MFYMLTLIIIRLFRACFVELPSTIKRKKKLQECWRDKESVFPFLHFVLTLF